MDYYSDFSFYLKANWSSTNEMNAIFLLFYIYVYHKFSQWTYTTISRYSFIKLYIYIYNWKVKQITLKYFTGNFYLLGTNYASGSIVVLVVSV